MIRTLIAEANPVARLGMRSLLGSQADTLEIDEAGSHEELLAKLRERYYEFIIVEPGMCGGAEAVGHLRELSPWSDILVFTALDELCHGVDAIRAGAKGYLMKTATREEFKTAVKRVAGGQLYLSKALAAEFATGMRKHDGRNKPHQGLSQREIQVLSLAVCGMTTIESAQILQIDTEAVNAARQRVMQRLRVKAAPDLLRYATEQGLLWDCRSVCGDLWAGRYGSHGLAPAASSSAALA